MKENKKLNKWLSVGMVVCFLVAFIISLAAKMFSNDPADYSKVVSESARLVPNWAAAAPFLVLSIIGLGIGAYKLVCFILNKKNSLKGNKLLIAVLCIEIAIVIAALFCCISLALLPTLKSIDTASEQSALMDGSLKCAAPIVTSALALIFAGADCTISFIKLDK